MSGRLVSIVFDSALPAWLKPYAAAFASFAADDGTRVYPTRARVAKMVGRSERSTQRALEALRARGVLTLVQAAHRYAPPRYVFHVTALPYAGQQWLFPAVPGPQSGVLVAVPKPLVPDYQGRHGCLPRGDMGVSRSVSDPPRNTKEKINKRERRTTLSDFQLEQQDRRQRAIDEQIAAALKRESA